MLEKEKLSKKPLCRQRRPICAGKKKINKRNKDCTDLWKKRHRQRKGKLKRKKQRKTYVVCLSAEKRGE